jgi:acyl transferase domain-containing protein
MATRPVHSDGAPVATPVAIIGMAALFPEARTLREF